MSHDFTLILTPGEVTDNDVNRLYEACLDDGTVSGSRGIARIEVTSIIALLAAIAFTTGCAGPYTAHPPPIPVDYRVDCDACPIHGTELHDEIVSTSDGHASYSAGFYAARAKLFPLANREDPPGESGGRAIIRFCRQCRIAQEKWAARHDALDDFQAVIDEHNEETNK